MKVFPHSLLLLLLVAACSQLGVSTPERAPNTVYESLWEANITGRGATLTVNQLRMDMLITEEQHSNALNALQVARDSVVVGLNFYEMGDTSGAQNALDTVENILRTINALIISAEEKRNAD